MPRSCAEGEIYFQNKCSLAAVLTHTGMSSSRWCVPGRRDLCVAPFYSEAHVSSAVKQPLAQGDRKDTLELINYLPHQTIENDALKTLVGDLSNRSCGADRCLAYRSRQQPRFFRDQLSVSFPLMIKSRQTGNRFVSSPAFDGNSSVPADCSRNMSHVLKRAFTGWVKPKYTFDCKS